MSVVWTIPFKASAALFFVGVVLSAPAHSQPIPPPSHERSSVESLIEPLSADHRWADLRAAWSDRCAARSAACAAAAPGIAHAAGERLEDEVREWLRRDNVERARTPLAHCAALSEVLGVPSLREQCAQLRREALEREVRNALHRVEGMLGDPRLRRLEAWLRVRSGFTRSPSRPTQATLGSPGKNSRGAGCMPGPCRSLRRPSRWLRSRRWWGRCLPTSATN